MDFRILHDEIVNDPLVRGYGPMTNAQVATSLNTVNRTITHTYIDPNDVYESIVQTEWDALLAPAQTEINALLGMNGRNGILASPGSRGRARFVAIFGAGSVTVSNVAAKLNTSISRAIELGLGTVQANDVLIARGGVW